MRCKVIKSAFALLALTIMPVVASAAPTGVNFVNDNYVAIDKSGAAAGFLPQDGSSELFFTTTSNIFSGTQWIVTDSNSKNWVNPAGEAASFDGNGYQFYNNANSQDRYDNNTMPVIQYTISGLTPGKSYNLGVVYWAQSDYSKKGVAVSLDPNVLSGDSSSFQLFNGTEADSEVLATSGNGKLNAVETQFAQNVVADASTQIKVYLYGNFDDTDRTVIQGLTFSEAAVPEPATMALLAAGGIALLRRKRK